MFQARPCFAALAPVLLFLSGCAGSPSDLPPGNPYAGGAQYPWSDRLESQVGDPYAGRDYSWTSPVASGGLQNMAFGSNVNHLSDMQWTSARNGWGPVERDRSNGEMRLGDGGLLSIGGQTFGRGLGVHADSDIRYALNGQCQTFSTFIGIDDETGQRGQANFRVVGDGIVLYESGELTGATEARIVDVPVRGVRELSLQVLKGADNYYDHADWADAKLQCKVMTAEGSMALSDLPYTLAGNGWGPVELDQSNGGQAQFDGRKISVGGQTFEKGLGVHAPSTVQYDLMGRCTTFSATIGLDGEVKGKGSVVFQVYGDDRLLFDSGVLRGQAVGNMTVDVIGVSRLRLVVTNGGDGKEYDHADWAGARLSCDTSGVGKG